MFGLPVGNDSPPSAFSGAGQRQADTLRTSIVRGIESTKRREKLFSRLMPTLSPNASGRWFASAEEAGEFVGIRFGRIAGAATEPEWQYFSHAYFDGIGAFAEILRKDGAILPTLPQISHPRTASVLPLIRVLREHFGPRERLRWREMAGSPSEPSSPSAAPRACAWHLFDRETTERLRSACRAMEVTVGSLLLQHLAAAIAPSLENPMAEQSWIVPVNLRGQLQHPREVDNHVSYVSVPVAPDQSARDVHRSIYARLDAGEHWGHWLSVELTKFGGAPLRRKLLAWDQFTSQCNLGAFSNLGVWQSDRPVFSPGGDEAWLFAPPVLPCSLVGAGCVTFGNRLSLLIQVHATLTTDAAIPAEWIRNWVRRILVATA